MVFTICGHLSIGQSLGEPHGALQMPPANADHSQEDAISEQNQEIVAPSSNENVDYIDADTNREYVDIDELYNETPETNSESISSNTTTVTNEAINPGAREVSNNFNVEQKSTESEIANMTSLDVKNIHQVSGNRVERASSVFRIRHLGTRADEYQMDGKQNYAPDDEQIKYSSGLETNSRAGYEKPTDESTDQTFGHEIHQTNDPVDEGSELITSDRYDNPMESLGHVPRFDVADSYETSNNKAKTYVEIGADYREKIRSNNAMSNVGYTSTASNDAKFEESTNYRPTYHRGTAEPGQGHSYENTELRTLNQPIPIIPETIAIAAQYDPTAKSENSKNNAQTTDQYDSSNSERSSNYDAGSTQSREIPEFGKETPEKDHPSLEKPDFFYNSRPVTSSEEYSKNISDQIPNSRSTTEYNLKGTNSFTGTVPLFDAGRQIHKSETQDDQILINNENIDKANIKNDKNQYDYDSYLGNPEPVGTRSAGSSGYPSKIIDDIEQYKIQSALPVNNFPSSAFNNKNIPNIMNFNYAYNTPIHAKGIARYNTAASTENYSNDESGLNKGHRIVDPRKMSDPPKATSGGTDEAKNTDNTNSYYPADITSSETYDARSHIQATTNHKEKYISDSNPINRYQSMQATTDDYHNAEIVKAVTPASNENYDETNGQKQEVRINRKPLPMNENYHGTSRNKDSFNPGLVQPTEPQNDKYIDTLVLMHTGGRRSYINKVPQAYDSRQHNQRPITSQHRSSLEARSKPILSSNRFYSRDISSSKTTDENLPHQKEEQLPNSPTYKYATEQHVSENYKDRTLNATYESEYPSTTENYKGNGPITGDQYNLKHAGEIPFRRSHAEVNQRPNNDLRIKMQRPRNTQFIEDVAQETNQGKHLEPTHYDDDFRSSKGAASILQNSQTHGPIDGSLTQKNKYFTDYNETSTMSNQNSNYNVPQYKEHTSTNLKSSDQYYSEHPNYPQDKGTSEMYIPQRNTFSQDNRDGHKYDTDNHKHKILNNKPASSKTAVNHNEGLYSSLHSSNNKMINYEPIYYEDNERVELNTPKPSYEYDKATLSKQGPRSGGENGDSSESTNVHNGPRPEHNYEDLIETEPSRPYSRRYTSERPDSHLRDQKYFRSQQTLSQIPESNDRYTKHQKDNEELPDPTRTQRGQNILPLPKDYQISLPVLNEEKDFNLEKGHNSELSQDGAHVVKFRETQMAKPSRAPVSSTTLSAGNPKIHDNVDYRVQQPSISSNVRNKNVTPYPKLKDTQYQNAYASGSTDSNHGTSLLPRIINNVGGTNEKQGTPNPAAVSNYDGAKSGCYSEHPESTNIRCRQNVNNYAPDNGYIGRGEGPGESFDTQTLRPTEVPRLEIGALVPRKRISLSRGHQKSSRNKDSQDSLSSLASPTGYTDGRMTMYPETATPSNARSRSRYNKSGSLTHAN